VSLAPGTRLGVYEVIGLPGAGGMGKVYRAKDTKLARNVAIKVLPEEFFEGEERRERFEREARLLAAINRRWRRGRDRSRARVDVAPDGNRCIVNSRRTADAAVPITVVVGWTPESR